MSVSTDFTDATLVSDDTDEDDDDDEVIKVKVAKRSDGLSPNLQ